ncbi:MAG: hypothetical protein L6R42_001683 [Xanthoria sp. 1 TBL-2021]|nr:MAG: hypothetical protein L6R42_001683 [Xanthoria sp. 1 TBL-2021]
MATSESERPATNSHAAQHLPEVFGENISPDIPIHKSHQLTQPASSNRLRVGPTLSGAPGNLHNSPDHKTENTAVKGSRRASRNAAQGPVGNPPVTSSLRRSTRIRKQASQARHVA